MNNKPGMWKGAVLVLAASLLAALALVGCEREAEEVEQVEEEVYVGRIVAVGDSLTAGFGLEESETYPAQLQRKLQEDGRKFEVINAGVSGETSSGALSRLNWILTQNPDIVILEIGANDGLRGLDLSVPRDNISKILQQLKESGVVTILAGMNMVWNLGPQYTSEFNALYPALAKEYEVIFMPFFLQGVAAVAELNAEDGIHPNAKGYAVVVENLYPYVIEAIQKLEQQRQESQGGEVPQAEVVSPE